MKMDRSISTIKRLVIPRNDKVRLGVSSIYKGHLNVTYRGVKAIRCPFDFVIYQMIISNIKPDLVIEIGTHAGGGALYLADLMNNIGHGLVHSIDLKNQTDDLVQKHPRIILFTEGWEKYEVKEAKSFARVLVIEDASHIYENTLGALNKFASLVTIGSYLIVEDGIIDELGMVKEFRGGPLRAIKEFLKTNADFEIDRHWCDFFGKNATFNVNGYLKKIK
jgi:cephalosporin hydroxylase